MRHSPIPGIVIHRVETAGDPSLDGFVQTYIDVFAGPPYFETYEPEWVHENVWVPHIPQCVMVAEREPDFYVVGLSCCHAADADTEPKIRDYLRQQELPFDPAKTVFMSELAVRAEMRRSGLGTALVLERMRWARDVGFTHYAMRTAADGSNSERLYRRLGAMQAPFVEDVSNGEVASASTSRIYLWGEIDKALS